MTPFLSVQSLGLGWLLAKCYPLKWMGQENAAQGNQLDLGWQRPLLYLSEIFLAQDLGLLQSIPEISKSVNILFWNKGKD